MDAVRRLCATVLGGMAKATGAPNRRAPSLPMRWPQPAARLRWQRAGVAVLLGLAIGVGWASLAAAQPPGHVRSDHWAYEALHGLAARGQIALAGAGVAVLLGLAVVVLGSVR
jgi:hypothetical protein